ncbi:MAG: putative heme protein [Candidatus Scalindua rubra]|uniref:Putative heme protein n=1 Tax=Candidatus Scalindua rubra TaxID=1872076 RepID=A0A1E3X4R9_9BACT|nr:MAG: putative heme protein [Candidatus Scalindua rubra]
MGSNIKVMIVGTIGILLFVGFCSYVTTVSGTGGGGGEVAAGINPEAGKEIFFGDGQCSTCHSVGGEGSANRCPNQGTLMVRVTEDRKIQFNEKGISRLKEREQQTGKKYSSLDYLVESIVDPQAYIVEGFGKIMPKVFEPPIVLSQEKILAVITYLQTLGGDEILEADINAVVAMKDRIPKAKKGKVKPWEPPLPVDIAAGESLFFDKSREASCVKCHTMDGKGGKVGPELTGIGAVQRPEYFVESLLKPSEVIVGGFETTSIMDVDYVMYSGIVQNEDEEVVELAVDEGGKLEIVEIFKEDIEERKKDPISMMPGNFNEMLNVQELYNVVAFLASKK